MTYNYIVILKNTNRKIVDRFSMLLCLASALVFIAHYIQSEEKRWIHLAGGILLAALIGINIYLSGKGKKTSFKYALFFAALIWFSVSGFQLTSLMFLVLGFFEPQAKKDQEIGFSDDHIIFNSFPRKQYDWSDFSNIILKDNLLTLDFNNNKIFQRETIDEEGDCEEEEFNQYCAERLSIQYRRDRETE